MTDDLKRRQPEDPKKININQPWEIAWWTSQLKITEEKLKQAVKAVGPIVTDVKEWLSKN